jgi:hypothetical protein
MLEKLLGVHRRTAIRLMRRFGGYQSGKSFLIERSALLRQLCEIVSSGDYALETGRRERLEAELGRARRDLSARRIVIPVARDLAERQIEGLPETIRLSTGRLEIVCCDAQDLLRQLMELAQAIANDFERFETVISPAPTKMKSGPSGVL